MAKVIISLLKLVLGSTAGNGKSCVCLLKGTEPCSPWCVHPWHPVVSAHLSGLGALQTDPRAAGEKLGGARWGIFATLQPSRPQHPCERMSDWMCNDSLLFPSDPCRANVVCFFLLIVHFWFLSVLLKGEILLNTAIVQVIFVCRLLDGAKWWCLHQFYLPGGYNGCKSGVLGEEETSRACLLFSKVGLHPPTFNISGGFDLEVNVWACNVFSCNIGQLGFVLMYLYHKKLEHPCFLGLTSWNRSCYLKVSQMDPNQSAWCLTPFWLTTPGVPVGIFLAMEQKARDPTCMTAFFSLLKQAVTRQYCSWSYIIGRYYHVKCLSLTQWWTPNVMCRTFLQIYSWILLPNSGS